MRDYVLVGDSTADLKPEIVRNMDVKIIPFSYSINDEVFNYYLDERDGDVKLFYDRLRKGAMPVTSQVNPVVYKELFEEIVKEGKDILYLCFTSGLSGSYQTAMMAVDLVRDEYPDARIEVVDSLCASVGEGVFLYEADKLKKSGMDLETLKQWLEDNKRKVNHWFMVEDLFHLKRGGRVTTVEAMVGSALKIKPILSVDEQGKLVVRSKARGVNKALDYLVDKTIENGGNLSQLVAVIGHADAPEKAEKIKNMVLEAGMKEENIIISSIGPIIGSHVGAGMAAIAFLPGFSQ